MTCADVADLLDAFVDTELPPPMLLHVARHAAGCGGCDSAVRQLTELRERVADTLRRDADALDLSGVWPAVAAAAAGVEARRTWSRRLRSAPVWTAAALALAASALVFVRPARQPPIRVAARPNQAVIERLDSSNSRVELRRDRKYGTTLIMVSATEPMP